MANFLTLIHEEATFLSLPPQNIKVFFLFLFLFLFLSLTPSQAYDDDVASAIGKTVSECTKIFVRSLTKLLEEREGGGGGAKGGAKGMVMTNENVGFCFNSLQELHITLISVKRQVCGGGGVLVSIEKNNHNNLS